MQNTVEKAWHLSKLDYRDGTYYPTPVDSFETFAEGVAAQRDLASKGIQTSLGNRPATPNKIYNIGMEAL